VTFLYTGGGFLFGLVTLGVGTVLVGWFGVFGVLLVLLGASLCSGVIGAAPSFWSGLWSCAWCPACWAWSEWWGAASRWVLAVFGRLASSAAGWAALVNAFGSLGALLGLLGAGALRVLRLLCGWFVAFVSGLVRSLRSFCAFLVSGASWLLRLVCGSASAASAVISGSVGGLVKQCRLM
jgi:hypothetical protein